MKLVGDKWLGRCTICIYNERPPSFILFLFPMAKFPPEDGGCLRNPTSLGDTPSICADTRVGDEICWRIKIIFSLTGLMNSSGYYLHLNHYSIRLHPLDVSSDGKEARGK